jgi:hypothetical protein
VGNFGDGKFAFAPWPTPFANDAVDVVDVSFSRNELNDLVLRVEVREDRSIYKVVFDHVSAFRVLDEHGLTEIWNKTSEFGGRPTATTFRVRNNLWSKESQLSFLSSDGWSYIIATDWDCVEIVSNSEPAVGLETGG